MLRLSNFFTRLFHWEYWPFHLVYAPIYPIWLLLCVRTRSFFFFNLGNPGIENGGFLMESKYRIFQQMPAGSQPHTVFVQMAYSKDELLQTWKNSGLGFPLIAKPDIGMRGLRVKKIESEKELLAYHAATRVDYLLQTFVPWPEEAGIFYYRYPDEEKGHISGIVYKKMLSLRGNGRQSIRELLYSERRYRLQIPALQQEHGAELNRVMAAGEEWIVPYGNHARGALFLDESHRADEALRQQIDQLCQKVPGFYYGRLDIRFQNWEDLREGKNFSVIELNGAGSEPTHMYDPRHSLFFAWKEIVRHWIILWRISRQNKKRTGLPYMTWKEGRQLLKATGEYVRKL
jgi:hypothetical protein